MGEGEERDRRADEREAELDRREEALAERMEAAQAILAAADRRDAEADARDVGAETREHARDKQHFLAKGAAAGSEDSYGSDLPARRGAALDREHAKGDRAASGDDREALTEET